MSFDWEHELDELITAYNRGELGETANGHWADGHGVLAIDTHMQDTLHNFFRETLAAVIGEDDEPGTVLYTKVRNHLRAEQRTKAGINIETKKGGEKRC